MNRPTLDDVVETMGEVVDLLDVVVTEECVLGEDIAIDSQQMLRVLSRLESRYRMRFAPDVILRLNTVGDLLEALSRAAGGR